MSMDSDITTGGSSLNPGLLFLRMNSIDVMTW